VRSPVVLLLLALAGMLGGGALVGVWALGVCLIFAALVAGVFGFLLYDFPDRSAQPARRISPVYLEDYLKQKAAENW
jgi:hypothetical protein